MRSTARRVRSSARVKSSVNQPVRSAAVDHADGAPVGELGVVGDVGGVGELVLVPDDERAVPADDDVGFDEVGAEVDGELEAGRGVLGAVRRGSAVTHDHGTGWAGRRDRCRRRDRAHVLYNTRARCP
jgi:hypothetical protein